MTTATAKQYTYVTKVTAKARDYLKKKATEQTDLPNAMLDWFSTEAKEATPGAENYEWPFAFMGASSAEYYDDLTVNANVSVDDATMAVEGQFRMRENFVLSRNDIKKNMKTPQKLFDLITYHSSRLAKRAQNKLAADIHLASQPSKGPVTIPEIFSLTPSTTGALHTIDAADAGNEGWANHVETGGGTGITSNYDALDAAIEKARNYGSGTTPTALFMSRACMLALKSGARSLGTYEFFKNEGTQSADLGVKIRTYEGIPIIVDRHIPTGATAANNRIYIADKECIKLHHEPGEVWKLSDPIDLRPAGIDGWKWLVYFAGQLATYERRGLAVVHNFLES